MREPAANRTDQFIMPAVDGNRIKGYLELDNKREEMHNATSRVAEPITARLEWEAFDGFTAWARRGSGPLRKGAIRGPEGCV